VETETPTKRLLAGTRAGDTDQKPSPTTVTTFTAVLEETKPCQRCTVKALLHLLSVSELSIDKPAGTEDIQLFDLELVYAGAKISMTTTTTTMTTTSTAAGRVAVRIDKGPLDHPDGGDQANGRRHPATRAT
jgi:hypothetical protein